MCVWIDGSDYASHTATVFLTFCQRRHVLPWVLWAINHNQDHHIPQIQSSDPTNRMYNTHFAKRPLVDFKLADNSLNCRNSKSCGGQEPEGGLACSEGKKKQKKD